MSEQDANLDGSNRDEILMDFQACTGIEDVEDAIRFLEQCNWNLVDAINNAIPSHTQTLPSERVAAAAAVVDPMDDIQVLSDSPPPPPRHQPAQSNHVMKPTSKGTSREDESDSSSVEDFPILDDDYALPATPPTTAVSRRNLIDEHVRDEELGTIQFTENFAARYGPCHPMFFHGRLDEALKEATGKPVRDRRLLAVYLHHDGSVLSNVFCQHVLCSESVVGFLTLNFVVWGWDVTKEPAREILLSSMSRSFGVSGVGTVRSLEIDRYPVIIVIGRRGGTSEICSVIHAGTTGTIDSLISSLLHTNELYRAQQTIEAHEEDERLARERVILEQNAAYEASLAADIAKDEAKRALESELKSKEQARVEAVAKEESERARLKAQLPPEPTTGVVCTLRVRGPDKMLVRKFRVEDQLKLLLDYLYSEGYGRVEYRFLFSHPKKDLLETHGESAALGSIFSAQDTLIVEKR